MQAWRDLIIDIPTVGYIVDPAYKSADVIGMKIMQRCPPPTVVNLQITGKFWYPCFAGDRKCQVFRLMGVVYLHTETSAAWYGLNVGSFFMFTPRI
jgi:hypothetical protein